MTELEYLRLQVRGIPVHTHRSVKRGEWYCRSPYCTDLGAEEPEIGPTEHQERRSAYDLGELSDA